MMLGLIVAPGVLQTCCIINIMTRKKKCNKKELKNLYANNIMKIVENKKIPKDIKLLNVK